MVKVSICAAALIVVSACTSYQQSGLTGGFKETRLNERTFTVRFRGNGFTSKDRASQFLLRRGAELALENGFRYFAMEDQRVEDHFDGLANMPERSMTIRLLETLAEDRNAADAVIIIKETDALAGGRLSDAARAQLAKFNGSGR